LKLITIFAKEKIFNMSEKVKLQELTEEEQIQKEFDALIEDYKHTNHKQKIELITKAFNFANVAHKGIKRRSGEPYIMHPLAVARIAVREIGLGSTSICSALLHDVVEDTDYTTEDIENLFGPKIAILLMDSQKYRVACLTKLHRSKPRIFENCFLQCPKISVLF